ncbi:fungal-specific transcription factor domain-containing protein [Plectosphaerella cucumerina]|uniref:Fungal-specific transcription factor domain-containing protein n=1 Tax=Plectosphaerella cucumerina TaxID=40658 RepID=A0A8K0X8E9_9PEZI|nr:fungal-specific transcription factor domain-containing protein [Plectosphaerella cucumerina]
MEQIETQVSDLRYLTSAPVPLPAERQGTVSAAYTPHHTADLAQSPGGNSAHSAAASRANDGSNLNPAKRRHDDESPAGKQQRSKRNRYISIACNECKRRKIKCNGETPCQRCGNLNLACLYAPNCCSNSFRESDEFKEMAAQLASLQEQVDLLSQTMDSVRSETLRLAPIQESSHKVLPLPTSAIAASPASSLSSLQRPEMAHIRAPTFRGPTSMAFSLDIANTTIHNMGYKAFDDGEDHQAASSEETPIRSLPNDKILDPLWDFSKDEMVRLCRLHEEEVGIMYPVVKIQTVIEYVWSLCSSMDSLRKTGNFISLNDDKTLLLKMVMCCAIVVEDHGPSERAVKLFESAENVLNRKLLSDACDAMSMPLLALLSGYRFLSGDEVLAWRVCGQVVRLCMELGIHQRTGLMKLQSDEERKSAVNSFWAVYVLDRRFAFGTGLPYVVQDEDIDPELPMPEEHPYLVAMISYSKLAAKVWRQVAHFGPILARELRHHDIEKLDQEILQWYEHVPEEVKLRNWDKEKHMATTPSYNLQRLRIWTYLRLNQIRIWLYTPLLHSATSIMSNMTQAQRVVDLAKDTIRYLTHLNNTTNLYRKLQVFYHHFLSSALAVLFLATVHAPVRFSTTCREEFYMALELVKDLSAKSWVSKRLWRTISSLKEVAPRIGLRQNQEDDPHNTAALTMAGLAAGRRAGMSPVPISPFGRRSISSATPSLPTQQSTPRLNNDQQLPNNGALIHNEMSRIFEGYVGVNNFNGGDQGFGGLGLSHGVGGPLSATTPTDTTVFQHFKQML